MNELELIKQQNEYYLAIFQNYLENMGISVGNIDIYLEDVDFFINDYVAEVKHKNMTSGPRELPGFFAFVNIDDQRKIRVIRSLKKFYHIMKDLGCLDKERYAFFECLINEIK